MAPQRYVVDSSISSTADASTPIHLTLDLDRQGLVRHGLEGTQSTHVVIAVRATKLWLVPSAPARGHS